MQPTNRVTALEIRRTIIKTAAQCGEAAHIGGSLSMTDLLNTLFGQFLRHRPHQPDWSGRDIFILSKGHAVLGYLSILHHYKYFDAEKLKTFQQNGSDLIAHPVKKISLGIESSNGSLGQGLSYGLGLAIGMNKRDEDRRVFVLVGDGECNEGSVWETAALAAELSVNNLVAIIDENGFRNDGQTSTFTHKSQLANIWRAFGWNVLEIDGHDDQAIQTAFQNACEHEKGPTAIVAKTVKGCGISFMEGNNDWHHNRITATVLADCLRELGV